MILDSEKKKTTLKRKRQIFSDDNESDSANDSSDNESSQSDSDDDYHYKTNNKSSHLSSDANSDPDYTKAKMKNCKLIEVSSIPNANIKQHDAKVKREDSLLITNNSKNSQPNKKESKIIKEKYSKTKNIGLSDSDSDDANETIKPNCKNDNDYKTKMLQCVNKKEYKSSSSSSESEDSKSSESSESSCEEDNNSLNHSDNEVKFANSKHSKIFASPNNGNIVNKSTSIPKYHHQANSQINGQYYPGGGSSNSNSPINQATTQRLNTMTCYDRAATSVTATNMSAMMIANFSLVELQEIQNKIASMQDVLILQRIVDLIEERNPRCFYIVGTQLQFDLLHLDSATLTDIQRIIEQ